MSDATASAIGERAMILGAWVNIVSFPFYFSSVIDSGLLYVCYPVASDWGTCLSLSRRMASLCL